MSICRVCSSTDMEFLFELGPQPLAGGFLLPDEVEAEQKYPLPIHVCRQCGLVQTTYVIPPETLFKNYLFSSSTVQYLVSHFANYASWLQEKYNPGFVVEFGCNDGILLSPLNKLGIRTCGIDISSNITDMARGKGLDAITGYFNEDMANDILRVAGRADIVTGSNAFPHNDHPENILEAARLLLKSDGHLCLEMMYAGSLLDKVQWDSMYHEHLSYFCLSTLEVLLNRYGFHSVHAEIVPMHAGSLRVVAAIDRNEEPDASVYEMKRVEIENGYTDINNWRKFALSTQRQIKVVRNVLSELAYAENTIWAYGAAGRATMWLNACEMNYLDAIVDESPLRAGRLMPGIHTPIVLPTDRMRDADYVLITAWNYAEQIMRKESSYEGIWIIPAPEMRFV
jgi:SAM-dependent methyltransferase